MVVAMRLMRMGTTHRPLYRISVADSRRAPTGKFIEHIGTYNPHLDKMGNKMLRLNVARAKYWIAMGCQPSGMVARLLSRFHLLPVPPQRGNLALVDPLVLKALAGEDIRSELRAQAEAPQQTRVNGVLVHPPSGGNRRQKELTPERIAQLKKQSPWKLQSFPFDYQPTESTMAAWSQARLFHGHQPHEDAVIDLAEGALFEGEGVDAEGAEAQSATIDEEIDADEDMDAEEDADAEDDSVVDVELEAQPEEKKTPQ